MKYGQNEKVMLQLLEEVAANCNYETPYTVITSDQSRKHNFELLYKMGCVTLQEVSLGDLPQYQEDLKNSKINPDKHLVTGLTTYGYKKLTKFRSKDTTRAMARKSLCISQLAIVISVISIIVSGLIAWLKC